MAASLRFSLLQNKGFSEAVMVVCGSSIFAIFTAAKLALTKAFLQAVMVACGSSIFALSTSTGDAFGSYDSGGIIRAPPVTDPWEGAVWLTNHSGLLQCIDGRLQVLWSHDLGEPSSTAVVFAAGALQGPLTEQLCSHIMGSIHHSIFEIDLSFATHRSPILFTLYKS